MVFFFNSFFNFSRGEPVKDIGQALNATFLFPEEQVTASIANLRSASQKLVTVISTFHLVENLKANMINDF